MASSCGCPLAKAVPAHDFCALGPQAILLVAGGLFAYNEKGSKASLYGGLGTAAVLAAAAGVSYKSHRDGKGPVKPATAVGLGVSAAVTVGMLTGCKGVTESHDKLAIGGAVLSTAFTAFYAWTLFKDKLKKA